LCRNPRLFEYPKAADTQLEIDDISISLFSVTRDDTLADEDDEFFADPGEELLTAESYELKFGAAMAPWDAVTRAFWEGIGWDISDGQGGELNCAHLFARQIIAVEGGLIEGARFTPDGTGRWYMNEPAEPIAGDAEIAARLQPEIDAFLARRRGP
jgi:hypothetical protein